MRKHYQTPQEKDEEDARWDKLYMEAEEASYIKKQFNKRLGWSLLVVFLLIVSIGYMLIEFANTNTVLFILMLLGLAFSSYSIFKDPKPFED